MRTEDETHDNRIAGTLMSEWEYIKLDLGQAPTKMDEIDVLHRAGREGWELVALTSNNLAYLKRPISQRSPAPTRKLRERRQVDEHNR